MQNQDDSIICEVWLLRMVVCSEVREWILLILWLFLLAFWSSGLGCFHLGSYPFHAGLIMVTYFGLNDRFLAFGPVLRHSLSSLIVIRVLSCSHCQSEIRFQSVCNPRSFVFGRKYIASANFCQRFILLIYSETIVVGAERRFLRKRLRKGKKNVKIACRDMCWYTRPMKGWDDDLENRSSK
jgi:hypothetical protein